MDQVVLISIVLVQTSLRQSGMDVRQCVSDLRGDLEREKQVLQRVKKDKVCDTPCHSIVLRHTHWSQCLWETSAFPVQAVVQLTGIYLP